MTLVQDWPWLLGLALGMSLAAPPGPMNALIARHSIEGGWRRGVRVGLAAPVADTLYLVVFGAGLGRALDDPTLLRVLAAAGAVLMAYLAYGAVRAREGVRDGQGDPTRMRGSMDGGGAHRDAATSRERKEGFAAEGRGGRRQAAVGFAQAFSVALLNPFQLGWWLTVGVVFVHAQGWQWAAGFLVGIFGWVVAFAWLVAHGARRWRWFTPLVRWSSVAVLLLSGVLLGLFAVKAA